MSSYRKYLEDFDDNSRRSPQERNASQSRQNDGFEIEGSADDIDLFSYNSAKQRRRNQLNEYMSLYDDRPRERESYGMNRRPESAQRPPQPRHTGGEYIGSRQQQTVSKQTAGARKVVTRANTSASSPAARAYTPPKKNQEPQKQTPAGCLVSTAKGAVRPAKRFIVKLALIAAMLVAAFFIGYYSIIGMMLEDITVVEVDTKWKDAPVAETQSIELVNKRYVKNVLLLGIDDDGSAGSRSDTIMIASVNTRENRIKLCSIVRDSYVAIPDHNAQKINAAHAFGGPSLTMQTIQNNFRVKLTKYISVDMAAMTSIVDAIGGVDIEITAKEAEQINLHSQ
ncbi:MAG: LCP family protein, partial [Clostridia bacterium]|nr:LCP family protein [Clostridia bacterium]